MGEQPKKKREKMPEIVFIGPARHRGRFRHMVFEILDRNEQGIPLNCRLVLPDQMVDVNERSDFMTAYLPEVMTEPDAKYANKNRS
jgi:hypothetical protein